MSLCPGIGVGTAGGGGSLGDEFCVSAGCCVCGVGWPKIRP